MKKQIKLTLTAIALTVALMVTACSKTDEILYEHEPTTTTTKAEEPEETSTVETTPADTTTTTAAEETAETSTTPAVTTTEATTATNAEPVPEWTESAVNATMYVNTGGIYSRKEAIMGSATVKQYSLNDKVTVVAITNTDYYKLSDGSYIHKDYLSSSEVTVTTTTTATATTTTTAQPKPTDYSYLNLTQSDIKYILGECQKYAESLGYMAVSYKDFMDKYYWDKPENSPPIYVITDFSGEGIRNWSWNVPIYFGNNDGEIKIYGELQASDTKEHFMEYTISRMCANIKQLWDTGNGNDVMIDCVKLSEFDKINKEKDGWSLRYEDWSDYFHWDMNTSYVFAPCYC